jgi:hypothetical protein
MGVNEMRQLDTQFTGSHYAMPIGPYYNETEKFGFNMF